MTLRWSLVAAALTLAAPDILPDSYLWVETGSRYENPVVLPLVLDPAPLAAALPIMRGLSRRQDRYVEDIIGPLLNQQSPRTELLVRVYLYPVWEAGALALWSEINPDLTERLIRDLPRLHDPHLRGLVLTLISHVEAVDRHSYLAGEAERLLREVEAAGGRPEPGVLFAVRRLADSGARSGREELASSLLEISRILRHREVRLEVRRTAAALLRGDGTNGDHP